MCLVMRSRAVSRPFGCCDSIAFALPPWRICYYSFLISVRRSIMRRVFFSNSGDLRFVAVFRTEADTLGPHEIVIINHAHLERGSPAAAFLGGKKPLASHSPQYTRFMRVARTSGKYVA